MRLTTKMLLRELPGIALTSARYALAEKMARNIEKDKPIASLMTVFVAADLADGAILRKFNLDTPVRRIADGVVDHLSMARVGGAVWQKHPETRPYLGLLAARALLVGGANAYHLLKTGEVTKGQQHQRLANLSVAMFAVAVEADIAELTDVAGGAMVGINAVTALPHFSELGTQHKEGVRKL